jgi:hypothetical protein
MYSAAVQNGDYMKGEKCPQCAQKTFHKDGHLYSCSDCKTVGWESKDLDPLKGNPSKCHMCGLMKARPVANIGTVEIWFCEECRLTYAYSESPG